LLTHTDLDAAGAAIIAKTVFPNIDIQHCKNGQMSQYITTNVVDNIGHYDKIIACDISCNMLDAAKIDASKNSKRFILLDHHCTATFLNRYTWACVQNDIIEDCSRINRYPNKIGHSSGTSLMFDYLDYLKLIPSESRDALNELAFRVALYDTWDWVELFERKQECYDLNLLSDIYSLEPFEAKLAISVKNHPNTALDDLFDECDKFLLDNEKKKITSVISESKKQVKTGALKRDGKYYKIAWCNQTNYIAETFDMMKTEHPECDIYMMVYAGGISLRSHTNGVHVGEFAKALGGGGHAAAAGISITFDKQVERLANILESEIYVDRK